MSLSETILTEFDRETALTRRLIERIPPDKWDWKPHPKSTALGALARHLAHNLSWCVVALTSDTFDVATRPPMPPTASPVEVLAVFDQNVTTTRRLLLGKTDDELHATWTGRVGDRAAIVMSKASVVSSMVLHHMIHHRGQLTVYLRLNDVPVASVYGPTADEPVTEPMMVAEEDQGRRSGAAS